MTTTAQLATKALQRLKVVSVGEAPSAEDQALAVEIAEAAYEVLADAGVAFWDKDVIPAPVVHPLSLYVASMAAVDFLDGADVDRWELKGRVAERQLRSLRANPPGEITVLADYF